MKSEKALGEVLKSVAKECRNDPIEQQLKKIGKAFIGNRIFGSPEAAMRELSMWLMKKSTKVTFVNSNMRDDRVSLPKSNQALHDMDEDEENIYMTSIHDRYASHPESLENMCLAKFAVTYEPKYESSAAENDELTINENPNDDENEDMNENDRNQLIKLKNNLGFMYK